MPKPRRYFISPLPWWSKKIKALRTERKWSQSELAHKLQCSSMTVSRWERGLLQPTPESLIALGVLTGPPAGWQFWRLAGISRSAIAGMQRMPDKSNTRGKKK
jgi:DNA-binding XRE family transcriptional regulator